MAEELSQINPRCPIGGGQLLFHLAATLAASHGPERARALFLSIAAADDFWRDLSIMFRAGSIASAPSSSAEAPEPNGAGGAVAAQAVTFDVIDIVTGNVLFRAMTEDPNEALDQAARKLGFADFAAAGAAYPDYANRVAAVRRTPAPAPAPPAASSTAPDVTAAPTIIPEPEPSPPPPIETPAAPAKAALPRKARKPNGGRK